MSNDSLMALLDSGGVDLTGPTVVPAYSPMIDPTVTAAQDILATPYQPPESPELLGSGIIDTPLGQTGGAPMIPDWRGQIVEPVAEPTPVADDTSGDSWADVLSSPEYGTTPETTYGHPDFDPSAFNIGATFDPDAIELIDRLDNPQWYNWVLAPGMTAVGKYGLAPTFTEMAFDSQEAVDAVLDEIGEGVFAEQSYNPVTGEYTVFTVATPESIAAYDAATFDSPQYADPADEALTTVPDDPDVNLTDEAFGGVSGHTTSAEIAAMSEEVGYSPETDPALVGDEYDSSGGGDAGSATGESGAFGAESMTGSNEDAFGSDGGGDSGGDGCFIADTLVTMANDTEKPICEVEIGDKVRGINGTINTVTFVEKVDWNEDYVLYSPVKHIEPFATRNHPIHVEGEWVTIDKEYTDSNHPWLHAKRLKNSYRKADKGVVVYNLWVDGDHTYMVNGYGTESLIGDGGVVRQGLESGIISMDDFVAIANGAKDSGFVINYGMHLGNRIMAKFSDNPKYTEWILDSVMGKRKGYIIKALIYIFGVGATLLQPKMWKNAINQYIISKMNTEVNYGTF